MAVFDRVVDPSLLVRRVFVTACGVVPEGPGEREPDLLAALAGYSAMVAEKARATEAQWEPRDADAPAATDLG